jgi:hypothetical protein
MSYETIVYEEKTEFTPETVARAERWFMFASEVWRMSKPEQRENVIALLVKHASPEDKAALFEAWAAAEPKEPSANDNAASNAIIALHKQRSGK